MPLDLRFVSIVSGETKTIEFVRDKARPVTGGSLVSMATRWRSSKLRPS